MRNRQSRKGVVRPLDPADLRNLGHPSHREQWLELARAVGRVMADEAYARDHQDKGTPHDRAKEKHRRVVRPILK